MKLEFFMGLGLILLIFLNACTTQEDEPIIPVGQDSDEELAMGHVSVQFIDASNNEPIANEDVEVIAVILCGFGENCSQPVQYRGRTNDEGTILIPKKFIDGYRIQIASGRFVGQGTEVNGKWIAPGQWDENIVEVRQENKEGTSAIVEEFNVNTDIIVIRLWHRSYWRRD